MTIFFFFFYFSAKTSLGISRDLSAWHMIHMKCQDLFSLNNNKKKIECRLLQIWLGALRVTKKSMKLLNLTHLLLKMTYPILANSVDPDQLASEEAN